MLKGNDGYTLTKSKHEEEIATNKADAIFGKGNGNGDLLLPG